MNIKQSETKTIRRSAINFNPLNPKRHADDAITLQAKNIKKVGILGGIVINEATGNILDGHRRVMALDKLHKYDGTPDTDYDIKVEATSLSDKEEKEQMTYMAIGNTAADLDLIAKYANEIDTKDLGLTEAEIAALEQFTKSEDILNVDNKIEDFFDFLPTATMPVKGAENLTPEEKKAKVLEGKSVNNGNAERYDLNTSAQIILSFKDTETKYYFASFFGDERADVISGENVIKLIEEK